MNSHLSSQQMTAWMVGERTAEVEMHLSSCASCQSEIEQLERTLGAFRDSVRGWSDDHRPVESMLQQARKASSGWLAQFSFAAAAIVLVLLATHLMFLPVRHTDVENAVVTDAALLSRVDQELSLAVPGPMQPLTVLVSWRDPQAGSVVTNGLLREKGSPQ